MYGLSTETVSAIQNILRGYPDLERAVIYGSRAKGNYRPGSDIDLVLEGDTLNLTTLQKIESKLDELLLPYKFDLSLLKQIKNPDLLDHIQRIGQIFYIKEIQREV